MVGDLKQSQLAGELSAAQETEQDEVGFLEQVYQGMYSRLESLKEKKPGDSLEAEKQSLREAWERQKQYYVDDIGYLIRTAEKLTDLICEVSDMFEKGTE